ncbi:hypothetical protein quinque_002238 [Culex quinquefasciatus]
MNRSEEPDMQSGYPYGNNPPPFVKEEPPASDILDLDSQKMVYPPEPVLPPMNSLHPLQSMQRHPMMWPHDPHSFMPPHDLKAAYYHPQIKSEYSTTPSIKGDYPQHAAMHYFPINGYDGEETTSDVTGTVAPISSGFPRYPGGAEMYQGDTAPPFSPNVPEHYQQTSSHYNDLRTTPTPQLAATAPLLSPPPSSPRVSSTGATGPSELHRCEECDKVFNKACYLTQHNKTFHSGDKPFKCQRCGKRFSCDQEQAEHLAKHGGEKPFKCELCPKQFNHKTDLRRHMCLHNGSKPYACTQCGKGFIRKDHMLKHCETHRKRTNSSAAKKAAIGKFGMHANSKIAAIVGDE